MSKKTKGTTASPIFLSGRVQQELQEDSQIEGSASAQGAPTGVVVFFVQPNVTESGSASYVEIGDIRQAASLLIYMGSPSRTFSIDATFISRSETEAIRTLNYVNILRSWRMPEKNDSGSTNVKSPSRLFLWGLNSQFKGVPVRMTDLSIPLNEETDYIITPKGAVPISWNISITLKEARSIQELQNFTIEKFRQGVLDGW